MYNYLIRYVCLCIFVYMYMPIGVDIYTLCVGGDNRFVTGGKNHIKFWDLCSPTSAGGELSSKGGLYGKNVKARTVVSSAFLANDCVTGMVDGTLVLWTERNSTRSVKAHDGPLTAMCAASSKGGNNKGIIFSSRSYFLVLVVFFLLPFAPSFSIKSNYLINKGINISGGLGGAELISPRIITGGKDGFVHVFNIQLIKEWSLDLKISSPLSACPQIQAVSTKDGRIIIGTKACEIYEVNSLNSSEMFRYVQGHFGSRFVY
jgi:hypothetical protein